MPPKTSNWDQCLQYTAQTDVGMRRSNNQDSHAVVLAPTMEAWRQRGHVFMVADGMGAHAAGELASKLAVDTIPHLYWKHQELSVPEALFKAIRETNIQIHQRGQVNADFQNMGTTVSLLALLPHGAMTAQVGDSRIYRLRGETIEQLSFDHSLVWELRAANKLPEDPSKIPTNVITRSLGPHPEVKADLEGPFPLEVGDTFLLCSDGLSGEVENEEIGALLRVLPPEQAARSLIDLANLRGGPDNITVVVAKVTGEQITTRVAASGAAPLTVGGPRVEQHRVHPGVWIAMGLLFVAGLVLGALKFSIAAVVALAAAMLTGGFAAYQKFGSAHAAVPLTGARRLGHGPHARASAKPDAPFVEKMRQTLAELEEAVTDEHWSIDRKRFEAYRQKAIQAERAHKYDEALRCYAVAISYIMQQLRSQGDASVS